MGNQRRTLGGASRISFVQQGSVTQNEFAKLVMMGSGGRIELAAPLTDEERRDFEVHVHGRYGSALALQVKSAMQLTRLSVNALYLRVHFGVRASRLVNDPVFWYFLAFFNPATIRFEDPTFLVPSTFLHEHATPRKKGDEWLFTFQASMEPGSHDQWEPYRVSQLALGKKVTQVIDDLRTLPALLDASQLLQMPKLIWARTA
jgi:hypothetical protein